MKRSFFIAAFGLILGLNATAQEKYSAILEQVKNLSTYEAIYLLRDYQYWHPEYASIYYHLGNLTYSVAQTQDPLHNYNGLKTALYNSRLFYGNCLHFAKNQKLPGWQFPELAEEKKRIEYTVLEKFVTQRLQDVKHRQIACDSIHNTFVRMAERYNHCQLLFTDFLNRYTRKKAAHLNLKPDEMQLLKLLQVAADSLDNDITAFKQALTLQPIAGYNPVFHKEPISLYRLDGLTYTDFLKNDIATWDYSRWVQDFINEQQNVYEVLYADLNNEQKQLQQQWMAYNAGQTISGQIDATLMGRCARLELTTPQVDSLRAMQETIRNCAAQQLITHTNAPQTLREFIPLLQIAATRRNATQDEALHAMNNALIQIAHTLTILHKPVYTHPITGETIDYKADKTQKVYCLVPDDAGYRCVLTDAENNVVVLALYNDLSIDRELFRQAEEQPLVFTKIPGQLWVLITDQKIYWMD